ncbi:hypothetical protein [Corallincola spongiicola]|uniref:Lipoprotein n=1 Tax=Corallincola spongiicola TaxID=2520508 RepID=A0ABY1WQ50_9GAMM|nr:hypothetical protein [Corallincola spongiicola]TAA46753.1 hypothetical protein EXY25_05725 [Corallincola spongiicola]
MQYLRVILVILSLVHLYGCNEAVYDPSSGSYCDINSGIVSSVEKAIKERSTGYKEARDYVLLIFAAVDQVGYEAIEIISDDSNGYLFYYSSRSQDKVIYIDTKKARRMFSISKRLVVGKVGETYPFEAYTRLPCRKFYFRFDGVEEEQNYVGKLKGEYENYIDIISNLMVVSGVYDDKGK